MLCGVVKHGFNNQLGMGISSFDAFQNLSHIIGAQVSVETGFARNTLQ